MLLPYNYRRTLRAARLPKSASAPTPSSNYMIITRIRLQGEEKQRIHTNVGSQSPDTSCSYFSLTSTDQHVRDRLIACFNFSTLANSKALQGEQKNLQYSQFSQVTSYRMICNLYDNLRAVAQALFFFTIITFGSKSFKYKYSI